MRIAILAFAARRLAGCSGRPRCRPGPCSAALAAVWRAAFACGAAALPRWCAARRAWRRCWLGIAWAALLGQWRLADRLPARKRGARHPRASASSPACRRRYENGVRFEFEVEQRRGGRALDGFRWPGIAACAAEEDDDAACRCRELHAGERWQLTRAAQAPARQSQSARLRLRGLAVRARHPRHRLRAHGARTTGASMPSCCAPGLCRRAAARDGSARASCAPCRSTTTPAC